MLLRKVATVIARATVVSLGVFVGVWLFTTSVLTQFFSQLISRTINFENWLLLPQHQSYLFLFLPTIILLIIVQTIRKICPKSQGWPRNLIIVIILIFALRYVGWRLFSTLNLSNFLDGIFSVSLFLLEVAFLCGLILQLYLLSKAKPRHKEADAMSAAVMGGTYQPNVDILIPTYNEPVAILKRTVIGCQAIEYSHKNIYLLDDNKRQEVRMLAQELGCEYLARPDNRDAKAGNLNHAIGKTSSELIAVFDADFIPTKNFLTRTVGFFQNRDIALLQTHQSFYNHDPVARNLGLEDKLTHEVELFSRYYQLLRDSIETALCYGSSFVVRRSALEAVGGFVTNSLSEDYFTSVLLSACGYRVIYLGETLSAGLTAENMATHIQQRLRWARGTLQGFFIAANPLKVPRLTLLQRLAHLEGMTQWFISGFRAILLLIPLLYTFGNIIPFRTNIAEWIYFFLPFYCLQLSTHSWLNFRSRSALMSDVYSVIQCFPVSLTILQTLFRPFSEKFRVTPKGTIRNKYQYNWKLALPLIGIFVLNTIYFLGGFKFVLNSDTYSTTNLDILESQRLAWIWTSYNLLIIAIALCALLDAPKPSIAECFDLKKNVQLTDEKNVVLGITKQLSEIGATVELEQAIVLDAKISIKFLETGLQLKGEIENLDFSCHNPTAIVKFDSINLTQYRQLVDLLFCAPGRWTARETPGELQSLWLLFQVLFKLPKKLETPKKRKAHSTE